MAKVSGGAQRKCDPGARRTDALYGVHEALSSRRRLGAAVRGLYFRSLPQAMAPNLKPEA